MTYGNTKVKAHQRVSKNGKQHTVKPHSRKYEMGEIFKGATPKKLSTPAMVAAGWGVAWYGLSTMMSVGAAAVYAVLVVCLGIITWLLMTKADRRQTRRELRQRASTSSKRWLRLMTHRAVRAPKKKAPLRAKKAQPAKKATAAKKTSAMKNNGPHKKTGWGANSDTMCMKCWGKGMRETPTTDPDGHTKGRVVKNGKAFTLCSNCGGSGRIKEA
jgi:hypothetical protein